MAVDQAGGDEQAAEVVVLRRAARAGIFVEIEPEPMDSDPQIDD